MAPDALKFSRPIGKGWKLPLINGFNLPNIARYCSTAGIDSRESPSCATVMAARGALCVFASLQGSFGTLLTDYQGRVVGDGGAFSPTIKPIQGALYETIQSARQYGAET